MGNLKKTLGQAIDELVAALEPLDEETRLTAVRATCEHLGLSAAVVENPSAPVAATDELLPAVATPAKLPVETPTVRTDIRSLRSEKQPKTDIEMACIVAYYLESLAPPDEQKQSIGKAEIDRYFKQAGHKLPKRSDQMLVNAKSAGYIDSAGRGKYRLNPVGHNLVVHTLPRTKS